MAGNTKEIETKSLCVSKWDLSCATRRRLKMCLSVCHKHHKALLADEWVAEVGIFSRYSLWSN